MFEVRLKKPFHGRLFPNGKEGDVKQFENWSDVEQLLAEGPTHFEWRRVLPPAPQTEIEPHDKPSLETNSDEPDNTDRTAPPAAEPQAQKPKKGRAKSTGRP